jgi:hypothetical protein
MTTLEEKEDKIIKEEAKKDDASELSDDLYFDRDPTLTAGKDKAYNPFDDDEVTEALREKDNVIADLKEANIELQKYAKTHDIREHPDYKQVLRENEELRQSNRELEEIAANAVRNTIKPAAELKGGLGH